MFEHRFWHTLRHSLAATLESLEVNGAAQEASPSLIWGMSCSSSNSDSLLVMLAMSNYCQLIQPVDAYLLEGTPLPRFLLLIGDLLLRLDQIRIGISQLRRDGWRSGVESGRDLDLLLVHLLHPLQLLVLRDCFQVLRRAVEQCDTNMRLLQGADIIRSIASHESHVAKIP